MSLEEVEAILGEDEGGDMLGTVQGYRWKHGPNRIYVRFFNGGVDQKKLHLATGWETLRWYAKAGAEKIGITWQ